MRRSSRRRKASSPAPPAIGCRACPHYKKFVRRRPVFPSVGLPAIYAGFVLCVMSFRRWSFFRTYDVRDKTKREQSEEEEQLSGGVGELRVGARAPTSSSPTTIRARRVNDSRRGRCCTRGRECYYVVIPIYFTTARDCMSYHFHRRR